MACSGERVCVLRGFFSVWSDHVDQLCISHISARLFTRHLYTQIEMVSYAVGKALGLVFFFLVVGFLVGYWFAKWFIKNHADSKFFSIVAWLNFISWLS